MACLVSLRSAIKVDVLVCQSPRSSASKIFTLKLR